MIISTSYVSNCIGFHRAPLNWRKRPEQMGELAMMNLNLLVAKYNKVHDYIIKMNGIDCSKFKNFCQNLLVGQRKSGLVLTNILQDSGTKLQVAKLNSKDENELLTVSWLDKDNKSTKKYRLCRDGSIYSPSAELKKQSPFNSDILTILNLEFDKLNTIIDNYKCLRTIGECTGKDVIVTYIPKMVAGNLNLKAEVDAMLSKYVLLHELFCKGTRKSARLKQLCFGETSRETKGFIFRNIGPQGELCILTPSKLTGDGRCAMIKVQNNNDEINKVYIFYKTGEVKTVINTDIKKSDLRSHNLMNVAKNSAEEKCVKQIIKAIDSKMDEFTKNIAENENCIKDSKVSPKTKIVKAKPVSAKVVPEIRASAAGGKDKQAKMAEKSKTQNVQTIHGGRPVHNVSNLVKQNIVQSNNGMKKPLNDVNVKTKLFMNMNLTDMAEVLSRVFVTPVENRSPHLIHERLADGKIFGGRFSIIAQDGAKVTVSRKKSNQIWNYTYYSVTVENGTKKYIVNFDPETGKLINSTKDGRMIVDVGGMSFISKIKMLERNADIIDLPQYVEELGAYDSTGLSRIVNFSKFNANKITLFEAEEKAVEEALRRCEAEDIQNTEI